MLSVISTSLRSLLRPAKVRSRRKRFVPAQALEKRELLAAQFVASSVTTEQLEAGDTIQIPVIYQTLDDSGAPAILKFIVGTGFWMLVIVWLSMSGRGRTSDAA